MVRSPLISGIVRAFRRILGHRNRRPGTTNYKPDEQMGTKEMSEIIQNARVAALSMANGAALARLLRAHGMGAHADALEAALNEVASIVSTQVGRENLAEAVSWVTDQIWNDE